ncbi:MAG: DUF11 domain-containing protein [Bacilli bacterium]|nr:DUF11 domain-containing protein [Bacilli bacterium]
MKKKYILYTIIVLMLFFITNKVYAHSDPNSYEIDCSRSCYGTNEYKTVDEKIVLEDSILKQYEGNTPQQDATFSLKDINNQIQINYSKRNTYHYIAVKKITCSCGIRNVSSADSDVQVEKLAQTTINVDDAYDVIEELILEQFYSITTYEKLEEEFPDYSCLGTGGSVQGRIVSKTKGQEIIEKLAERGASHCTPYINIVYPMIVEETKSPPGYKKAEKYVVLISGKIIFSESNNQLKRSFEPDETSEDYGYYRYDPDYDYSEMYKLTEEELTSFKNEYKVELPKVETNICHEEEICEYDEEWGYYYNCSMQPVCNSANVIVNSISGVDLKIENYIEDTSVVAAKKGDKLKYKVVVANQGVDTSHSNVITSVIPKELTYVEGSASGNATYNKITKTITWTVSELDPNASEELTYDVTVNNDIADISTIQMRSSITSDETTELKSMPVTVTVEEKNSSNVIPIFNSPKTGALLSIIMLISSLVIVGFLTIKYFKKQQNN